MSVKVIRLDQLPKARRIRISPIKKTKDWTETMERVRAGNFAALEIKFSPETLELGKSTPDRFKRMLGEEIKVLGLSSVRLSLRGISTAAPVLYVIRQQARPVEEETEEEPYTADMAQCDAIRGNVSFCVKGDT